MLADMTPISLKFTTEKLLQKITELKSLFII